MWVGTARFRQQLSVVPVGYLFASLFPLFPRKNLDSNGTSSREHKLSYLKVVSKCWSYGTAGVLERLLKIRESRRLLDIHNYDFLVSFSDRIA